VSNFRLSIEQPREQQRFGGRLGPADRFASADQFAKIERIRAIETGVFKRDLCLGGAGSDTMNIDLIAL
jgi:hypothetical protein